MPFHSDWKLAKGGERFKVDLGGTIQRTRQSTSQGLFPIRGCQGTKIQFKLIVNPTVAVFFVEQTRLDIAVVLVFLTGVFAYVPREFVVKNLTDTQACVDSNWLHCKHFDSPVSAESSVTKTGRAMHKQTEAGDRTSTLDHRNQIVRFGVFYSTAKIDLAWAENHALVGDRQSTESIWLLDVQHYFFVNEQLVVECQVVAVRIQTFLAKRSNSNVCALPCPDFFA